MPAANRAAATTTAQPGEPPRDAARHPHPAAGVLSAGPPPASPTPASTRSRDERRAVKAIPGFPNGSGTRASVPIPTSRSMAPTLVIRGCMYAPYASVKIIHRLRQRSPRSRAGRDRFERAGEADESERLAAAIGRLELRRAHPDLAETRARMRAMSWLTVDSRPPSSFTEQPPSCCRSSPIQRENSHCCWRFRS